MSQQSPLNNQMFTGIRVVELAQFVFVPAAGAVLADLGAEVIKIEALSGDPYRTLRIADGRQTQSANLSMEQNNRGKKSVALDLKTAEGRELLLTLVDSADVFLTSLRPGALERLGLGADALRARCPKLIYVRGNGLGFNGPEADRPGFDASCFWARGGFAGALTPAGQSPIRPRPGLGDHAGSMSVAFGIAAALFNRERSGDGAVVETSLLSSAMWILSADIAVAAALDDKALNQVGREGRYPLTTAYETADGRWIQLMFLDPERYWPGLCHRIGCPELLDDSRFATADDRVENGELLIIELRRAFKAGTLADWRGAFAGWDAPWEVVQSIRELAADPQAEANGYLFDVRVADGTPVKVVAGPVSFNGSPQPVQPHCSPALGRDTLDILRELGVDDNHVRQCQERKILVG